LVGSNPPGRIREVADERITVTGYISEEELAAYYRRSRVAVAPLRFGAGLKGKVIEAMRFGIPVVTTPIGLQGLGRAAEFVPAGDDAQDMVEAIVCLHESDDAWIDKSTRGQEFVRANFSLASMREILRPDLRLSQFRSVDVGRR